MVRSSPQKEMLARFKGQGFVDEIELERSPDISFSAPFCPQVRSVFDLAFSAESLAVKSRNEYETRVRATQMEPSVYLCSLHFQPFP
jgi:hypothetical protein